MNRIFLALRAKVGWLHPFPNPDIDAANHPTITSQSQPRLNRFLITFQSPEAARLGAEMLFVYGAKAVSFPFNDFKDKVNPYIDQEKEKWEGVKLPRAGIGCWNPVFPARADDIWMMTSIAAKEIEVMVNDGRQGLRIFSLKTEEQSFAGVEQMS